MTPGHEKASFPSSLLPLYPQAEAVPQKMSSFYYNYANLLLQQSDRSSPSRQSGYEKGCDGEKGLQAERIYPPVTPAGRQSTSTTASGSTFRGSEADNIPLLRKKDHDERRFADLKEKGIESQVVHPPGSSDPDVQPWDTRTRSPGKPAGLGPSSTGSMRLPVSRVNRRGPVELSRWLYSRVLCRQGAVISRIVEHVSGNSP